MGRADSRVTVAATVVCCLPGRQHEFAVELPGGATLRDAVLASGLLAAEPGLAADALDLGVHGQPCAPATPLRAGDRVEVYRRLLIDPKEARRLRAERRRPRR